MGRRRFCLRLNVHLLGFVPTGGKSRQGGAGPRPGMSVTLFVPVSGLCLSRSRRTVTRMAGLVTESGPAGQGFEKPRRMRSTSNDFNGVNCAAITRLRGLVSQRKAYPPGTSWQDPLVWKLKRHAGCCWSFLLSPPGIRWAFGEVSESAPLA